jgi:hypothetical protein
MFDHLIPTGEARDSPSTAAPENAHKGMFDHLIPKGDPEQESQKLPSATADQPAMSSPYGGLAPVSGGDDAPERRVLADALRNHADRQLLEEAGPVAQSPLYAAVTSFGNVGGLNIPRNLGAAVRSLKTGRPFNQEYEYIKSVDEASARQSPWTSGVAGVAGALGSAAALPIAPAATLPGRIAQGAGIGGAYSGLSELADTKDTARATKAAGMGAAFGAAAPPLLEGAARAVGAVGRGISNTVRPFIAPDQEAARRVSGALARDAAIGGTQLDDAALAAAQRAVQPAVVADMGGKTTQALARSAANTSPEARHALESVVHNRFEGQAPRVSEFVLGLTSGQDALTTREALQAAATKANRPAYAKAYAQGANGVWNEGLADLTRAPVVADAIKGATKTGANKAVADGFRPITNPFAVNEAGDVVLSGKATPTLQFWDHVKRNMDDRISTLLRSGEKSAAGDAIQLKNQLVSHLESAAPAYAEARAGAAKFFGAEDALEAGQKFVAARGKNSEYARAIGKMSEPERKLFADGFASELATKINETGDRRSVLNSVFNSPNARERVRMALGPEKAKEFEAFMHVETMMDGLRQAVTGNSTTARQLAEAGLAGGLAGGVLSGGDPRDISVGAALGALARTGSIKVNQRVAQRVGEMLASPDPEVFRKAVRMAAKNRPIMDLIKSAGARLATTYEATPMAREYETRNR